MSELLKNALASNASQESFFGKKKERAPKKKLSFDKTMKVLADAKLPTVNKYTEKDITDIEELMSEGKLPKQLKEFLLTYGAVTFNADSGKVQVAPVNWVKAVIEEQEKIRSGLEKGMFPLVKGKDIWVTCAGSSSGSVDQVKRKYGVAFDSSTTIFPSFGAWLADVVQETYDLSTEDIKEDLESLSEENCVDCGDKATTVSGNFITNQPAVVKEDKDSGDFTYDEGKGKKDIVQLTGPLSEVYTRALNIYYAKKPAFDTDSIPDGLSQSETEDLMNSAMIAQDPDKLAEGKMATESAQLEDTNMRAIIAAVQDYQLVDEAQSKFAFVNDSLITDIKDAQTDIVAQFTPFENALKPEVVDAVHSSAEDKGENVVMVITDNDHFFTHGLSANKKFINLNENSNHNPVFGPKDFDAAIESLYTSKGIKVVNGFEGLVTHLNTLAKN